MREFGNLEPLNKDSYGMSSSESVDPRIKLWKEYSSYHVKFSTSGYVFPFTFQLLSNFSVLYEKSTAV